jgi:hypothetical protein
MSTYKRVIGVAEVIDDNRITMGENTIGTVTYVYKAPTHWSCSIITIYERWGVNGVEVTMNYGSGGINSGFTEIEVAGVMAQAFTMARDRLIKIEEILKEHNI